jgi:hypothetical protein
MGRLACSNSGHEGINERNDRRRKRLDPVDLVDSFANQRRQHFGFRLGVRFTEFALEESLKRGNLLLVIVNGSFEFR